MKIILYSTGCPRCNILKAKLDGKHIQYTETDNVEEVIKLGFKMAPVLKVDDELMGYKDAVDWVNSVV